jgi:5'-nucleotidase
VSASERAKRPAAAQAAARIVERTWRHLSDGLAPGGTTPLLNINVPAGDSWQVVATRVGRRLYDDDVIYRSDPRGREYLWIGGTEVEHDRTDGTDTWAWEAGHIGVTPLSLDLSASEHAALVAAVV